MTEAVSLKPDLGRFGVWVGTRSITPELATEIESLGYGAAWIGGSPDADLAWVDPALAQTTSLQLATGIVNIWSAPAPAVAERSSTINSPISDSGIIARTQSQPCQPSRVSKERICPRRADRIALIFAVASVGQTISTM